MARRWTLKWKIDDWVRGEEWPLWFYIILLKFTMGPGDTKFCTWEVFTCSSAWWQTPNTYYFKHIPNRVIFEPGNSRGRGSGGVCTVPIKKGWLLAPLPIRFQNAREMYKIAHSIWLFWLMFTLRQYIQEHTYLALLRWHLLLIPHSRYSQYIQCLPTVLLYQT